MLERTSTTGLSCDFGAAFEDAALPTDLTFASELGTEIVRFPVRWDVVQAETETAYDWSSYEALLQQIVWYGFMALPAIVGCPTAWLSEREFDGSEPLLRPTGHKALNALGEFAVHTARFFGRFGARVAGIEVWSEPNNADSVTYVSDPADYRRMVSSVNLAIASSQRYRGLEPVRVVAGGLLVGAGAELEPYLVSPVYGLEPADVALHVPPDLLEAGSLASFVGDLGKDAWITTALPETDSATSSALMKLEEVGPHAVVISQVSPAQSALDRGLSGAPLVIEGAGPGPEYAALQEAWAG